MSDIESCSKIKSLFEGYIKRKLTPNQEIAVIAHLDNCSDCNQKFEKWMEKHL